MDTAKLKRFAQDARRMLIEQVETKLTAVLKEDSLARRESKIAVHSLEEEISKTSRERVVERVAYLWFNRFCAFRFMDVNGYTKVSVVSPREEATQPEILAEAKAGQVHDDLQPFINRERLFGLLSGSVVSNEPQQEAYRMLLVASCNQYHKLMPFLFEKIEDFSELLLPDDLLSGNSILAYTREAMTKESCENVEVIGWLYQFYISEKKDKVFSDLKKNKKITPENIPAATQLFTPNWIVRYMVENSLGRLWMLNRPNSKLINQMEYYIPPASSGDSGQRSVDSKNVNRDQCSVERGINNGKKFQRTDSLAKSDGLGRGSVSSEQILSEGGDVCFNKPGSEGNGFGSFQHRGGVSSSIESGISQFSFDLTGVTGGSGDSDIAGNKAQLHIGKSSSKCSPVKRGDQQNAECAPQQTGHCSQETDYLRISSPLEIRICDPACGSGHILVYAFELLYSIYEEEGFDAPDIPGLILQNNLFGIEIDERAAELAAFALVMKAREKDRRFFKRAATCGELVEPNICLIEKVEIEENDLQTYMDKVGRDLFTANLEETLRQFKDADNFGSLIRPIETDVESVRKMLETKGVEGNMFLAGTHESVLKILRMVEFLRPRYHVVVANPPYMGGKGMNEELGKFAKKEYPDSKSDLFAMFIERNLDLVVKQGCVGMITMQSWMFLSSFESLRKKILENDTILSMSHLGARGFDSIGGEVVQTTAFVLEHEQRADHRGEYLRLVDGENEAEKQKDFRDNRFGGKLKFTASAEDFGKVPGCPIAYWFPLSAYQIFEKNQQISDIAQVKTGMTTADNERFVRAWYEISYNRIGLGFRSAKEAKESGCKWFPYNKGGGYRKWYGFAENLVNWENDGLEIKNNFDANGKRKASVRAEEFYFKKAITYSAVTSGQFSSRLSDSGFLFDSGGSSIFSDDDKLDLLAAMLSTKIPGYFLEGFNDTINFQPGDISRIPVVHCNFEGSLTNCLKYAKTDWNSFEISWDFQSLPLINSKVNISTIAKAYGVLLTQWRNVSLEMQHLEEENNRIFIEAYGLQDELTPEVPLKEITLTCNPYYRYGDDKTPEQLEGLLLQDTMKEFISYSVGCMFGRYSLDKPGLVLANQGETLEDYLKQVPQPTFMPDEDNVIPLMEVDWFPDDLVERFKRFLKTTFGEENFEENLRFIEEALGYKTNGKGKPQLIRDYFLNSFYTDHLKTYKKRPIYWMFSSPKGTFNALIYMHRYRPDTVSIILNDYLRVFRTKLEAYLDNKTHESISPTATAGQKTAALREIEKLKKQIAEIDEYERDVLYPLAGEKIEIDLDDGVKKNYPRFGKALRTIPGLDKGEE